MSWVKVDDAMPRHPKLIGLGKDRLACQGLWLDGMCYASHYLTDGIVPDGALQKGTARYAERLVTAGLWDRIDGGYRIHDYLEYQPSKADVLEARRKNAQRQSRHRNADSDGASNGVTNGGSHKTPAPTPTRPRSNERDARGVSDVELAAHRLRYGHATERQVDAFLSLAEQVGEAKVLQVAAIWEASPVKDRYGKALAELEELAARKKRRPQAVESGTDYDALMQTDDGEAA
ncbi:MAG TPA: hypothetical protein VIB47_10980 [Dehalococcoidia bacterium]|jgi:hypothetical protein